MKLLITSLLLSYCLSAAAYDFAIDGPFEFYDNGELVGSIDVRTTSEGRKQLVLNGTSGPAITIGGDKAPSYVQMTPEPMDKPPVHIMLGYIPSGAGQGTYGDVYINGTIVAAPTQVAFDSNGVFRIPADPRGAINLGRSRDPNENLGLIRFWRVDANDGQLKEEGRMGLSEHGFPYLNGGGNDNPRIRYRFGDDYLKITLQRPSDGKFGELSFDNSGALKWQSPAGTITTIGDQ